MAKENQAQMLESAHAKGGAEKKNVAIPAFIKKKNNHNKK